MPIFAPNITVAACASDIMPALTKPITITEVALELCITAVAAAPTPTPSNLLLEAFENSILSLLLPNASKLELIIEQAIRKTPTPAIKVSTDVIIATVSILYSPCIKY